MEKEELIEKIKLWDFKKNSKKMFAEKYNISIKTVDRYIEKYNIPYEKRVFGVVKNRDKYGRYRIDTDGNKVSVYNVLDQSTTPKDLNVCETNNKNKPIRSFKEYNKKYDEYFTS
jgi:hypothetical protein